MDEYATTRANTNISFQQSSDSCLVAPRCLLAWCSVMFNLGSRVGIVPHSLVCEGTAYVRRRPQETINTQQWGKEAVCNNQWDAKKHK